MPETQEDTGKCDLCGAEHEIGRGDNFSAAPFPYDDKWLCNDCISKPESWRYAACREVFGHVLRPGEVSAEILIHARIPALIEQGIQDLAYVIDCPLCGQLNIMIGNMKYSHAHWNTYCEHFAYLTDANEHGVAEIAIFHRDAMKARKLRDMYHEQNKTFWSHDGFDMFGRIPGYCRLQLLLDFERYKLEDVMEAMAQNKNIKVCENCEQFATCPLLLTAEPPRQCRMCGTIENLRWFISNNRTKKDGYYCDCADFLTIQSVAQFYDPSAEVGEYEPGQLPEGLAE